MEFIILIGVAIIAGACLMYLIMYLIMYSMSEKNMNEDSKDIAIMENWEKKSDEEKKN